MVEVKVDELVGIEGACECLNEQVEEGEGV